MDKASLVAKNARLSGESRVLAVFLSRKQGNVISMRKISRAAMAAALLAIVPLAAEAQGQAFLTVSTGQSHYSQHVNGSYGDLGDYGYNYSSSTDRKDTTFGVTGGYRWVIDDVFSIGPEAGFVDLGETKTKEFIEQPGVAIESARASVKNKAALLGVNAKWMLGHAWSVGARAGLTHTWIRAEAHVEGEVFVPPYAGSFATSSKYSSHDNGYYGAVNVGYDFTRHTGVSVGYEYYHNEYHALGGDFDTPTIRQNIGVWAASFEYRF